MFKVECYIPATHLKVVKEAMFNAGAGRLGQYQRCAWQTLGQGQFEPIGDSQPFIGKHNELSAIDEYKVELVCGENDLEAVINAMKSAHPYEVPAYFIIEGYVQ